MKTLWLTLLLAAVPALANAQASAGYVGNESCKTCHEEAYEQWKAGPHARATASLTGKSAQDGRCLSCHAPAQTKGVDFIARVSERRVEEWRGSSADRPGRVRRNAARSGAAKGRRQRAE